MSSYPPPELSLEVAPPDSSQDRVGPPFPAPTPPPSTLGSDNIYHPRPGTIPTPRHRFLREDVVFLGFEEMQAGEVAHVPRGHTVQVSATCPLPIHSPELDPFALFAETNFRFF